MSNLITRARALYNLNNLATSSDEDTTLDALIIAVSGAIEKYCGRTFAVTSYDEIRAGNSERELLLRNYPVAAVERVAFGPTPVFNVTNTSSSNQRATVKVTSSGLQLIRVATGVTSTNTVLFSDRPTLAALVTGVNAVGSGWAGSMIDSADSLRASTDLRALQGACNAMNINAPLLLHKSELTSFSVDDERGILTREAGAVFHGGPNYWRVLYSAGYSALPDEVEEACAQWVAQLFWQTKRDPGLSSEAVPGTVSRVMLREMPASVRLLLGHYRDWRV